MCLMCIEIARDRMNIREARSALPELVDTAKDEEQRRHYQELQEASDEELKEIAKKHAEESGS